MFDALFRLFMYLGGGFVLVVIGGILIGMIMLHFDRTAPPGETVRPVTPGRGTGTSGVLAPLAVAGPGWLAPLAGYLINELPFPLHWGQVSTVLCVVCLFTIPAVGAFGVSRLGQFRTGWVLAAMVYYLVAWVTTLVLGFLGMLQSSHSGGLY